jgi:hypothetical protein
LPSEPAGEDLGPLTRLLGEAEARLQGFAFMNSNPKLAKGNPAKIFFAGPLKLILVFLIRFLPLLAVPGASCGSGRLNRAPDRCLALVSCAPSYPSCS